MTSGSNGSCGGLYLCTGAVGYDGPTGLGTPCGTAAFGTGPFASTSCASASSSLVRPSALDPGADDVGGADPGVRHGPARPSPLRRRQDHHAIWVVIGS